MTADIEKSVGLQPASKGALMGEYLIKDDQFSRTQHQNQMQRTSGFFQSIGLE